MEESVYLVRVSAIFGDEDSFHAFDTLLNYQEFMRRTINYIDSDKNNWVDLENQRVGSIHFLFNEKLNTYVEVIKINLYRSKFFNSKFS